jgi:hypothetical protein
VAVKYHEHLAGRVDVRLTDQAERIEASRRANGDTEVTVRVVGADGQPGPTTFHRVFDAKETGEVRFYTYNGNDTLKVTGDHGGPKLRMIGGNGADTLDATGTGNAKLSDSEGQNRALDAADDDREYTPPPPPKNAPWIPPRDWTRETTGMPVFSYGGDLGVVLGYAVETRSFGFRKAPFSTSHRFSAAYAFKQQGFRVDYTGQFHRENSRTFFGMYAYASSIEVLRFYGFGNDTEAPAEDQNFYKVNARTFVLYPTFQVPLGKRSLFTIGPLIKYTESDETKDQFINEEKPYGVGNFAEAAVHGVLQWDGRDSSVFPRRGVFAAVRGTWYPKLGDVESDFGQVNGNLVSSSYSRAAASPSCCAPTWTRRRAS